tara:strand:- start:163 stop:309 length:147 start_codon:yes stop_codon:yes gene_type:complete
VGFVDERDVGCLRLLVPGRRDRYAARVLRGGDDDEILILEFFVDCLPT